MRDNTTESSPGTGAWRRTFSRLFALLLLTVALACGDDALPTTGPSPTPSLGVLTGTVTLLGDDGPSDPPGHISLYASLEDLERRIARHDAPLVRRSGAARTYGYTISNIVAGDYYVMACWSSIGCGEYRTPGTGALRTVRIQRGRLTTLQFGL